MAWQVVDFQAQVRTSSPAGATGEITIAFTPPRGTQLWRVESISCACTSGAETDFAAYDRTPGGLVPPAAATVKGNLTVGDGTPITILGGNALTLVWRGASAGAVASCRVQYQVLQGSPGAPSPVAA